MKISAIPLQVISAPNFFTELENDRWEITDPNAQTLWLQLAVDDSLGMRRYIPTAGATLSVIFQRSVEFNLDGVRINRLQSQDQTVTKTASANADDRSMWQINLTSADAVGILSGTVKFTLTESGTPNTWVQNYFLKKNLTEPGF